jgi:hypothetical protein
MKTPRLIAHRGLLEGPDKKMENDPVQIERALELGFDCEVDLWCVDERFYLGHDAPTYAVDRGFLGKKGLWVHAKNLDALYALTDTQGINYFWHENDSYALTSNRYVWTYPGRPLTGSSVAVMPEWQDPQFENLNFSCFGICSDYGLKISGLVWR